MNVHAGGARPGGCVVRTRVRDPSRVVKGDARITGRAASTIHHEASWESRSRTRRHSSLQGVVTGRDGKARALQAVYYSRPRSRCSGRAHPALEGEGDAVRPDICSSNHGVLILPIRRLVHHRRK